MIWWCLSDSPSVRLSVWVSVRPFSALSSYMLWHIELKFCRWLCFNVLQINFWRSYASLWKETKLDGKQELNVLYQVCVCPADRKKKMTTLVSDWLRHFRLLLWNRWMEFNETWQKARSQHPLLGLGIAAPQNLLQYIAISKKVLQYIAISINLIW